MTYKKSFSDIQDYIGYTTNQIIFFGFKKETGTSPRKN